MKLRIKRAGDEKMASIRIESERNKIGVSGSCEIRGRARNSPICDRAFGWFHEAAQMKHESHGVMAFPERAHSPTQITLYHPHIGRTQLHHSERLTAFLFPLIFFLYESQK